MKRTIELEQDLVGATGLEALGAWVGLVRRGDVFEVDFGRVRCIDASGVAGLVRLYTTTQTRGATLSLVSLSHQVYAELERIGLADVLGCRPGVWSAAQPSFA